MNVDMQNFWYSPAFVIHMQAELVKIFGQEVIDKDGHSFKKVGEMKCTAIMLLALHKAFGYHFFMQASKDEEEFPDVWTLYQEEVAGKNVDTKFQTVEVVTYTSRESGDVADFILSHKLVNPKKSYDTETIILCYIRKKGTFIDFNDFNNKFKKHKFNPSRVFIIGNLMGNESIFTLTQVWPSVHTEAVDYVERTKTYPLPHRMFFKKGITKKMDYGTKGPRLPINPYEVFYIDEKKVKAKYKK